MRKEIILQEKLQNSSPPTNKYIILYAAGGKLADEGEVSEECGMWSEKRTERVLGSPVQGELDFRLVLQAEKTEGLYP